MDQFLCLLIDGLQLQNVLEMNHLFEGRVVPRKQFEEAFGLNELVQDFPQTLLLFVIVLQVHDPEESVGAEDENRVLEETELVQEEGVVRKNDIEASLLDSHHSLEVVFAGLLLFVGIGDGYFQEH